MPQRGQLKVTQQAMEWSQNINLLLKPLPSILYHGRSSCPRKSQNKSYLVTSYSSLPVFPWQSWVLLFTTFINFNVLAF